MDLQTNPRIDDFFRTARLRHEIYLSRQAGDSWPWTEDPIYQRYKFCNVFRELDRTTVWFQQNVREPLRSRPEVLLATVVFRLFNRVTTGEAIFQQLGFDKRTAFERFLDFPPVPGDPTRMLHDVIQEYCGAGPYVTGAFIVKTPEGMSKLGGVLWIIEQFAQDRFKRDGAIGWRDWAESCLEATQEDIDDSQVEQGFGLARLKREGLLYRPDHDRGSLTLEHCHYWLENHPFIGHFQAYEIVSDLRHTDLLCRALDVMTWANPGPGCTRGLNLLFGRDTGRTPPKSQLLDEMRMLLESSRYGHNWPGHWPLWEMREVEHWCCEWLKYDRARSGGRLKERYRRP